MFRFTDLIILRLTRDCNLHCKYCFMKNIIKEHKGERIDFELYKQIIEKIIQQRKLNRRDNILNLIFHGGEPLLVGKEKFYKVAEYARRRFQEENLQLELGMQTNASLLDDDMAKMLNKFDIDVGLSFDGINSDKSRDIKIEIFEQKFDILKKNNVQFGILVVLGKHNIDNFSETIQYIMNLGVDGFKISYAEDMFTAGPASPLEVNGEELFDKAFKLLLDYFLQKHEIIEFYTRDLLQKAILDILFLNPPSFKTGCGGKVCGSALEMVGVEPNGTANWCDRWAIETDEIYVMNVLDKDFLGLHQIKRALDFAKIKHQVFLETGCDTCYADYICNHGCLSFYYGKYGRWGIDKRIVCPLHKKFYNYVLTHIGNFLEAIAESKFPFSVSASSLKLKDNALSLLQKLNLEIKNDKELYIVKKM